MEVTYKDIPGFPDYRAGDDGTIWGCKNKPKEWRLKSQHIHQGYPHVWLFRDGKDYKITVHKLVLTAFVGPRPEGCECGHKNGNKEDNRLCNLRWVSPLQNNVLDRIEHGEFGAVTALQAAQLKRDYYSGSSLKVLSTRYGLSKSTVYGIVSGKRWKHLSFTEDWAYDC